jgi:hypothetical protein
MNHADLIIILREKISIDKKIHKFTEIFQHNTNEILIRMMFSNYRGQIIAKGFRLNSFGLEVMKTYFEHLEVKMPEGEKLLPSHLLYLDKTATQPYYCDGSGFVFFDSRMGIKLKLADGKIKILLEIEN